MDELKPCPFCGSDNLDESRELFGIRRAVKVYCLDCQASGPATDPDADADGAWNQRLHDMATMALAKFGAAVIHNWHANDALGFEHPSSAAELDETAVWAGVQENVYGEGLGCSLRDGIAVAVDRLIGKDYPCLLDGDD